MNRVQAYSAIDLSQRNLTETEIAYAWACSGATPGPLDVIRGFERHYPGNRSRNSDTEASPSAIAVADRGFLAVALPTLSDDTSPRIHPRSRRTGSSGHVANSVRNFTTSSTTASSIEPPFSAVAAVGSPIDPDAVSRWNRR